MTGDRRDFGWLAKLYAVAWGLMLPFVLLFALPAGAITDLKTTWGIVLFCIGMLPAVIALGGLLLFLLAILCIGPIVGAFDKDSYCRKFFYDD